MSPSLTFRRALPEEVDALRALTFRSKASHGYDSEFMQHMADDLAAEITAEVIARDTFMVAEIEGRTVGFARLMPVNRPDTVYLEDLFIEPDAQGMGVGRALFEWALAEARDRGYGWLEWDSDPNAAAFYERMGGERIGETESSFRPGRMIPKFRMSTNGVTAPR